ncbi:MAG: relaxase [Nitrosomonas sp.]|nr:relaxase [Nitrosomonas sp.]MCW5608890.1 relaxase [Nitrosomonas sp.]
MILEGNQRGGARQLARHLMNRDDNEHVEVHEISSFMSDSVMGAFDEIHAVSRGTKCRQFMFSVSLNPPQDVIAPPEYFEKAIAQIEERTGLSGQPRVIVFHEKEGRRHAHAVWSRIDANEMKAINLPQGFIDKQYRNPLNFTRAEWQQAKRTQDDPRMLKQLFRQVWEQADNQQSFQAALKDHGFWLARGDRRGFVAVDYKGEVYSLSRWTSVKSKELKQRLSEPERLPDVQQVKIVISQSMTDVLKQHIDTVYQQRKKDYAPLKRTIHTMKTQHRDQRDALEQQQQMRWQQEEQQRIARLPRGLSGIWQRITGKYRAIKQQNQQEVQDNDNRDRDERQALINRQLQERQRLQERVTEVRERYHHDMLVLRKEVRHYHEVGEQALRHVQSEDHVHRHAHSMEPRL